MELHTLSAPRAGAVVVALALLLTGCASANPSAAPQAASTPAPTPTAACPEMPGVELPPECAGYDPDAAMAQNDLYRERMDMSDEAKAQNTQLLAAASASLESLRTSAQPVTENAVRAALEDAGALDVQTRAQSGAVLFGAAVPGGGCVYGAVEESAVTAELGGFIMDGGCLPAQ